MKYPRYRVATCEGWPIRGNLLPESNRTGEPGLSATVCDTLHMWREIKTYRSEDRALLRGHNARRGREGALKDAEDHAAYLNEVHRRELHTEAVRAGRKGRRDNGLVG